MKFKKFTVALMSLMLCGLIFAAPAHADTVTTNNSAATTGETGKNETVYAMLGYDGGVNNIYVVNQLVGSYTDYGRYSNIKNLSTTSVPVVESDKITFPDGEVNGGLYYQGTMEGELPMTFTFTYYIDGQSVNAESLAGASGHLKIKIDCAQNEACDARIRDGLMAQIIMNLDLGLTKNVKADGATTVITGNSMNVAFAVLPGEDGSFTVEADVADFEMDAIAITLTQGGLGGYEDSINEYEKGFDDMLSGADDMVDGTSDLKDGVGKLANGMGELSNGLGTLESSGGEMVTGMQQFGVGLQDYTQGVSGVVSASEDVLSGLNTLAENGSEFSGNLSALSGNVSSMASNAELRALAQSLTSSSDPAVQALANSTLAMLDSLGDVSDGLSGLSDGLNDYVAGVGQAASGYEDFNTGLSQAAAGGSSLVSGYNDITNGVGTYVSGVGSSASGASRIYRAINGLPDNIQELIDGQIEFRDGISTAKDELMDQTDSLSGSVPVSFASPDKNHPLSVQYILTTPAIEKQKIETNSNNTAQKETFFTRFADLFS